MNIKQSYIFVILSGALIVVVVMYSGWAYLRNMVEQPVVPDNLESYTFEIEANESVDSIISRLVEMGVFETDWPLNLYLYFTPEVSKSIQAGQYQIAPGLSMVEVIESFKNGHVQGRLTFLEGWRREEYAAYLIDEMGEEFAQEFLDITKGYEGQLFPDTYFTDDSTTAEILRDAMLENYQSKIGEIEAMGLLDAAGLSEEEALILASIIEREVPEPVDQVLVADIMIRRYQAGMALGADATVQYVIANRALRRQGEWKAVSDLDFVWWPRDISMEELELDSDYNTRKNVGLPPTPIANPGLNALIAVAEPLSNNYWYYLTDHNGVTRYAESLEEHNQNITQFGVSH